MQELVVATRNKGKLREIQGLLKEFDLRISSLADYPEAPTVEEDGRTFSQNALKKAVTIAFYTKKLTLGEDSGLEVKALKNAPGVYSARFAGQGATDKTNNLKLLRALRGIPSNRRQARYRCAAALVDREGIIGVVTGVCEGIITARSRGKNGFGYDPLFLIPRYGKTFGELENAVKEKISHRARALGKLKRILEKYFKK
jgi:XTP/dITP diphosphohydrolase